MNKLIKVVLVVLLIALLFTLAPMVFLWSINTLAEAAGTAFYIPHGFWTYVASLGIFSVIGGARINGTS